MTGPAGSRPNHGPMRAAQASGGLTQVELTWIEKRMENWIRFGRPVHERLVDQQRRVLSFRPGNIFAFLRWAANDFGTIVSRIDVVRAIEPGEAYQTLPFVRPGGEILLNVSSWPKVERVLQHIDAIERLGIDPSEVAPEHWRHVHGRITAGLSPRPYMAGRHRAWLKRREIER